MSDNTSEIIEPFAWFKTDVNGKPVEFTHTRSGAEAWQEQGYILTPVYRHPYVTGRIFDHETGEFSEV